MNKVLIIWVAFGLTACSPTSKNIDSVSTQKSSQNIINGVALTATQVPQMQGLYENKQVYCSATLIGPRVILTAAHCAYGFKNSYFGPFNGFIYKVQFVIHPQYSAQNESNIPFDFAVKNDLAIGYLSEEIADVKPMTLSAVSPKMSDMILGLGTGQPTLKRTYGFYKVVTLSDLGITVRAFGAVKQIGAPGDSGGPNLLINAEGNLELVGPASTSTRLNDWSAQLDWKEAIPYTEGIALGLTTNQWIRDTVAANSLKVCGVNLACEPIANPFTLPQ